MQVWHDVAEVPEELGRTVVTIGNFDGVHLGHRHVIETARTLAAQMREDGDTLPVVAVTFDPHPIAVIAPDRVPQPLSSLDDRIERLGAAGVDAVLVVSFTPAFAKVSAEDFITQIVLGALHARTVVVGDNFRFGYRALGDVALLSSVCARHGVGVVGLPLDGANDQSWSSSYIRRCVADGDVEAATEALGRPFDITGYVVRGDQRGRGLGYPTANVPVSITHTAVPADGVYAGWLRQIDDATAPYLPAAISVGTNPTFAGRERRVESYVLDRTDLELYGVRVEVLFVKRLRGMVTFDSVEGLVEQMKRDVDQARALLVTPPGRPRSSTQPAP